MGAWKDLVEQGKQRNIEKAERKTREHEIKAGKSLRSTRRQLKKADKAEERAAQYHRLWDDK